MPRSDITKSGTLFKAADVLRDKAKELRIEAVRLDREAEDIERRASEFVDQR